MEPIAISVRGHGEWILIHRCTGWDHAHANRTAGDDNPLLLVRVRAVRPIRAAALPTRSAHRLLRDRVAVEAPQPASTVTRRRFSVQRSATTADATRCAADARITARSGWSKRGIRSTVRE